MSDLRRLQPQFALCAKTVTGDFQPDIKFVRHEEGGNDDDPDDPGGRTSRGIEQREWNAWCILHHQPISDVWKAPDAAIDAIYYNQYWMPYTPECPPGVNLMFFDTHVSEGLVPAVKFLQNALKITPDGKFGIITASHLRIVTDCKALILDIASQRRDAYRGMARFWKYGKGWLARVDACQEAALAMVKP